MLGPDVDAVGFKIEEIGACWGVPVGRVPPVGVVADILHDLCGRRWIDRCI